MLKHIFQVRPLVVNALIKLSTYIIKDFDKYLNKNNIELKKIPYIKYIVDDLNITLTGRSMTTTQKFIEKIDMGLIFHDYMKIIKEKNKLYNDLVKNIFEKYESNIEEIVHGPTHTVQVEFWLDGYLSNIIIKHVEKELTDEDILNFAVLFDRELNLSSLDHIIKIYLDGILIDGEDIKLNKNTIFRKVKKEDLEYSKPLYWDTPVLIPNRTPSAILEGSYRVKNDSKIRNKFIRIITTMRLFNLGSVDMMLSVYSKNSFLSRGTGYHHSDKIGIEYRYLINEINRSQFINFINEMEKKIDLSRENKREHSIVVSLERYNSVILERIDIERKVMTAIMGLESLYSLPSDKGENSYKLGIRVSRLMSFYGSNSVETREVILKGYTYRNKVVHGSFINLKDQQKMREILPILINILRKSLIFFILGKSLSKNTVINLIEKSILKPTIDDKIMDIIDYHMTNYSETIK